MVSEQEMWGTLAWPEMFVWPLHREKIPWLGIRPASCAPDTGCGTGASTHLLSEAAGEGDLRYRAAWSACVGTKALASP